ncbi:MAG TPA: LysR substrate-binding domain-containing protein [Bacteroidia bacterium]|nr:LysR substrate-binding domain-containing protein [Bacteroidia bacterium]
MNLQQLEYIIAIDTYRHFAQAAESCFVTQPTLSMMVQKLEDELGLKLFDRSRQPVEPTADGVVIISRAKEILAQVRQLKDFAQEQTHEVSGELHLVVIPTLAPYVLPFFLNSLVEKHPRLKVFVREATTSRIIEMLKKGEADLGLLSTPLNEPQIKEFPLFYEELLAYYTLPGTHHKKLKPGEVDLNNLWLLEEGHCFRSQVLNYCELQKQSGIEKRLEYEAGSIQTLINMLDSQPGITIVPQLATYSLSPAQKKHVIPFVAPQPVREISLVASVHFSRTKVLEAVRKEILGKVPAKDITGKKVIEITKV